MKIGQFSRYWGRQQGNKFASHRVLIRVTIYFKDGCQQVSLLSHSVVCIYVSLVEMLLYKQEQEPLRALSILP